MARSAVKRPPPRIADLDADHLYNPAARAVAISACDHGGVESMGKGGQVLCDAVRNARE